MENYFKDNDGQNENYQQQKLTHEEIRQFQQFSEISDKEIEDISTKSWAKDKLELWRQLKQFFVALDEGLPPRIHKFNGGLFRQNQQIDDLKINDVLSIGIHEKLNQGDHSAF